MGVDFHECYMCHCIRTDTNDGGGFCDCVTCDGRFTCGHCAAGPFLETPCPSLGVGYDEWFCREEAARHPGWVPASRP